MNLDIACWLSWYGIPTRGHRMSLEQWLRFDKLVELGMTKTDPSKEVLAITELYREADKVSKKVHSPTH